MIWCHTLTTVIVCAASPSERAVLPSMVFSPYRLSIMLAARQTSILGITPETLQDSASSVVIFIACLL